MVNKELKIALTQLTASREKDENLKKIKKYAKEAAENKSDLVVFPEVFMFYFGTDEDLNLKFEKSESIDGKFVDSVKRISKEYHINIIFGMHEKSSDRPKTYNTTLAINEQGEVINLYRKTHLYDAFGMKESDQNVPGTDRPKIFKINDFNIGVIVCYEIRFPEMARILALDGADLIVVPSAWVKGYNKEDFWLSTVKTRAMENTVYIGTSNQIGNVYTGIAAFVDPLGILIERATEEEGMIIQRVKRERIIQARKILPLLSQRNTSIYS
ncbi:MAG: carbon-nitrogen hydrolase family protein [Candidatus Parvarchaeota archaeon]